MKRKKRQSCCLAVGQGPPPPPPGKNPWICEWDTGPCLVFVPEIRYAFLVMPGSCGHHRIHHVNDNSRFY